MIPCPYCEETRCSTFLLNIHKAACHATEYKTEESAYRAEIRARIEKITETTNQTNE